MMSDDDRHVTVRFYHGAILNSARSEQEGRKVYDDLEMCEIKFPGDISRTWVGPAHKAFSMFRPKPGEDSEKGFLTPAERFPEHYKRFKATDPQAQRSGTPLEHLPFLTPAKVYELKAQNIFTAESLAHLSESAITKLHVRPLVERTKVWLGEAEASAVVAKAQAEKQALADQFEALRAEIEALKAGKAPASDGPDGWSDEALRAFLADRGANPRANAARDKLVAAVQEIMEQEAAFKAGEVAA